MSQLKLKFWDKEYQEFAEEPTGRLSVAEDGSSLLLLLCRVE